MRKRYIGQVREESVSPSCSDTARGGSRALSIPEGLLEEVSKWWPLSEWTQLCASVQGLVSGVWAGSLMP